MVLELGGATLPTKDGELALAPTLWVQGPATWPKSPVLAAELRPRCSGVTGALKGVRSS